MRLQLIVSRGKLPRDEVKTRLALYGTKLFTLWFSGTDTGGSIGVSWGKRNVHVTMWMRDDVLNCHITDDGVRVWERTMTLAEMSAIVRKMERRCIGRWSRNERIIVLDPSRLNAWEKNTITQAGGSYVDLAAYVTDILPAFLESDARPVRIRDALGGATLLGFQYRRFKWHIVIAEPSGEVLRWPVDLHRGPLRKVVTVQGFHKYFRYIEKQGFFEYIAPSLSKEATDRLTREIELAALRAADMCGQAVCDCLLEKDQGGQ